MIIDGWRGPSWRVVDADPRYGGQIREWIRSAITRHNCPVDAADAALAVAELYANAVMHGPAGGRVLAGILPMAGRRADRHVRRRRPRPTAAPRERCSVRRRAGPAGDQRARRAVGLLPPGRDAGCVV